MTLTQPFIRDRTTWLAYLLLALYGYFLNIFGPITPFLKEELHLSYTVSSLHFSAFALGIIGAGLIGHQVVRRLGRWTSLWLGTFGMSLFALLLIAGLDPVVTIGASFLMGLIGSLILTIIPSILSDHHGDLRSVAYSEANVVSSFFSALAPVLVGWFVPVLLGWRTALIVGALAAPVLRLAFGRVSLPEGDTASSSAADGSDRPALPFHYWIYWLALVVAVSIEFCMIFWSADYFEIGLGMVKADAAQAVSLFLGGMIAGRLAGSRLVQRFRTHYVILAALAITSVGFLIYWTALAPVFGVIGLGITGLGVASLYPLILSLAIGSVTGSADRASARASLASGVAIFLLPLILGRLADAVGIRTAYAVIILLLVILIGIMVGTVRFTRLHPALSSEPPLDV